jgi:hypothetical protein
LLCAFLLGACHKDQPARPTAEQSAQLNDADAMLNSLASEQGAPDRSAGAH